MQDSSLHIFLLWGTPISIVIYAIMYIIFRVLSLCFISWSFNQLNYLGINIGELYNKIFIEHTPPGPNEVLQMLVYSLVSCVFGIWLGNYTREKVIELGLDVQYSILRFSNDWFYMLSGRDKAFERSKDGIKIVKKISTIVDVLCVIDHSPIIFSGYLLDYNLKKDGSLEFIRITDATRTPLEEFSNHKIFCKDTQYKIPGNGFIIKGEEIKNINCRYVTIPELKLPSVLPQKML